MPRPTGAHAQPAERDGAVEPRRARRVVAREQEKEDREQNQHRHEIENALDDDRRERRGRRQASLPSPADTAAAPRRRGPAARTTPRTRSRSSGMPPRSASCRAAPRDTASARRARNTSPWPARRLSASRSVPRRAHRGPDARQIGVAQENREQADRQPDHESCEDSAQIRYLMRSCTARIISFQLGTCR